MERLHSGKMREKSLGDCNEEGGNGKQLLGAKDASSLACVRTLSIRTAAGESRGVLNENTLSMCDINH